MFKLLRQYRRAILVGFLLGLPVLVYSQTTRRTDTTPDVNRIRFIHQYPGATTSAKFTAAIADTPATGALLVAHGFGTNQTLNAAITINKPIHLVCNPGVTFTLADSVNASAFTVTSDGVTIDHCTFDGNKANQTAGHGITATAVDDLTIISSTFQNFYGRAGDFHRISQLRVYNNQAVNNGQAGNDGTFLYRQDAAGTSTSAWFQGNDIDSSGSDVGGILVSTTVAAAYIEDLHVDFNTILAGNDGLGTTDTLAIELWTSGGGGIRQATVNGNIIEGESNASGYKIFGISIGTESAEAGGGGYGIAVNGNTIKNTRQMGIELFGNGLSANGNTLQGTGPIAILGSSKAAGILHSSISVQGNTFIDPIDTSWTFRIDGLLQGLDAVDVSHNTISSTLNGTVCFDLKSTSGGAITNSKFYNNSCVVSTGTALGLAASGSSVLTNVSGSHNKLIFTGATGTSDGIQISNSTGTKDRVSLDWNEIIGATRHGIYWNGTGTNNSSSYNKIDSCGTDGIRTEAALDLLEVVGNTISNCGGTGIILASSPTNVIYYGNNSHDNTTADENLGAATFALLNTTSFFDAVQGTRWSASRGTDLVAGDFALSAGWGTTASVGSLSGGDQFHQFTVTSAGADQAANPTLTLTFQDGTWTTAPIVLCSRQEFANQPTITFTTTTVTATTYILTFNGTPVAAETYRIACHVGGI